MSRKLHIGGKVKAGGWEILDAIAAPHVDHVCNANNLSIFPDNTFETLYASHVLEHFDYAGQIQQTLAEWYRVLKPKGKLYISVPDLDVLAALMLDKQNLTGNDRFQVMRMIFGGHIDQYDYHLIGLNQEFLTGYLIDTGFVNLFKVEKFGLFPDTSGMKFKDTYISLNVVAEKPE